MTNNIVSLSGGKDSTAMLLMMLERGEQVHGVVFCDMGPWEFPQMHDHIEKLKATIDIPVVTVNPRWDPVYMLTEKPVIKKGTKEVYRLGNNWPSALRRWCTREKMNAIRRHIKTIPGAVSCIGFAADETDRCNTKEAKRWGVEIRFPLIEYGVSEPEALRYCYDHGFDWGGLYKIFGRVSCFCCPLQRIGELRKLRKMFPDLWAKMLAWDSKIDTAWGVGFKEYKTVHDLDRRFAEEDRQMVMFEEAI